MPPTRVQAFTDATLNSQEKQGEPTKTASQGDTQIPQLSETRMSHHSPKQESMLPLHITPIIDKGKEFKRQIGKEEKP